MGAKTTVDASVIKTMGTKLEIMDSDLNSALEMLRKDHMCCRGHDISTKEDKKAYDELKDKLLGHNVTWGGTEDDQGASGSLGTPGGSAKESPYVKYQEAAKLDLPCLRTNHGEQPNNEVQHEAGPEKEASEANPETSSEPLPVSPEMMPGTPQSLRVTQLRGTPKVTVEGTPQPPKAMAKPLQPKVQDTTQFDTPSPVSTFSSHKEADTTSPPFSIGATKLSSASPTLNLSNSLSSPSLEGSPALSSVAPRTSVSFSPALTTGASTLPSSLATPPSKAMAKRQATPKRVSSPMSPSLESATKRRRTWRQEEVEEDSDSEGPTGSTLDSTYECISSLPSTAVAAKEGMNDTMVLVARLDSAGLDSPAPAQISISPRPSVTLSAPSSPPLRAAGANSTFAVSEAMDVEDERAVVEHGQFASHGASLDSAGLTEVSFIVPPPGPSARSIRASSASPIKAGMGVRSPVFLRSPSPLRQSTLLDLGPKGKVNSLSEAIGSRSRTNTVKGSPSLQAPLRRSPRSEFLAPTPRMPGSTQKPKAGLTPSFSRGVRSSATTPQPQRKVMPKKTLKHSVSVGVLPQPTYMAATRSSKGRSGSTTAGAAADKKENPETVKPAKGLTSTVSHRLDKLKKQISGVSVLKPNNKS